MAQAEWERVYDILVECCGASELTDQRAAFLAYMAEPLKGGHEWRFGGWLGFGGKLYANSQGVYVDCYSEQKSPIVAFAIRTANERIAAALQPVQLGAGLMGAPIGPQPVEHTSVRGNRAPRSRSSPRIVSWLSKPNETWNSAHMSDAERDLAFAQTIGNIAPVDRDSFNRGWASADARVGELERERDEARNVRDHRLGVDPVVDGPGWEPQHLRPRPGELEIYMEMCRRLQGEEGRLRDRLDRLSSDEVVEAACVAIERVTQNVYGIEELARAVLAAVSTVLNGEGETNG